MGRRNEVGILCDMLTTNKNMKEETGKCCAREKEACFGEMQQRLWSYKVELCGFPLLVVSSVLLELQTLVLILPAKV